MGRQDSRSKILSISKFHKKKYREFLRELGFADVLPKLEKNNVFWYFIDQEYAEYQFYPEDFNIPRYLIDEIEKQFHHFNRDFTVDCKSLGKEITPADLLGKYTSVVKAVTTSFHPTSQIYRRFSDYMDGINDKENMGDTYTRMFEALTVALLVCSSLEGSVYGCKQDIETRSNPLGGVVNIYKFGVYRKKATQKKLKINGQKRQCYELLINSGLESFYTQKVTWEGKEHPVYVQGHALNRVVERLCITCAGGAFPVFLLNSMFDDIFLYNERILIPVFENPKESNTLVGYFMCDIAESEEMVIRTFLFVSQNGTPEGDRLSKRLAIDKGEKQYLEMENYDHFVKSDLREDDTIVDICRECGLDHLFELKGNRLSHFTGNASFIKETLQLGELVQAG